MNYTKCYFDRVCVCNLIFYRPQCNSPVTYRFHYRFISSLCIVPRNLLTPRVIYIAYLLFKITNNHIAKKKNALTSNILEFEFFCYSRYQFSALYYLLSFREESFSHRHTYHDQRYLHPDSFAGIGRTDILGERDAPDLPLIEKTMIILKVNSVTG